MYPRMRMYRFLTTRLHEDPFEFLIGSSSRGLRDALDETLRHGTPLARLQSPIEGDPLLPRGLAE